MDFNHRAEALGLEQRNCFNHVLQRLTPMAKSRTCQSEVCFNAKPSKPELACECEVRYQGAFGSVYTAPLLVELFADHIKVYLNLEGHNRAKREKRNTLRGD